MRLLTIAAGLLVASAALAGCTSTPVSAPSPVPEPSSSGVIGEVQTEPSWDADLTITREFPDADGNAVECSIYKRAVAASENASDELRALVDAARAHLAASDWSATEVSLDAIPSDELEARRAQGVSDPELYTMVLSDLITEDLSAQGLVDPGVSVEGFVSCG